MRVALVLVVEDDADVDRVTPTSLSLTAEAYDRLVDALADAGFGIETGPTTVLPDEAATDA